MAKRPSDNSRMEKNIREVETFLAKKGIPPPGIQTLGIEGDPLRVLLSTILSLRTRDPVMEAASLRLFSRAPDLASIDLLEEEELERIIYPVGFYRTKAKTIKQIAKIVLEKWKGSLPSEIAPLLSLPGVGLKTATLVLGAGFGKNVLTVDTHVHRIANRWGAVRSKNADDTYWELEKNLPDTLKLKVNPILVSFGQTICLPLSPRCSECPLSQCPKIGVKYSR
ncbi:MAG: endonuclease III domain-containing protein [Leptospirillia bacterium]